VIGSLQDSEFPGLFNLSQDDSGNAKLFGQVVITPEFQVSVSITGNNADVPLITISNPETSLLQHWGFDVVPTAPSTTEIDNNTIYLPSTYEDDIDSLLILNNGQSKNLVTFTYIDSFGRTRAVYPPKSLNMNVTGESWNLTYTGVAGKIVNYYDQYDRVIVVEEPDAGTSKSLEARAF